MPKASAKSRKKVLYLTVFFTNLLSLACQVIWVRKLSFLFGSTAGVFSTVLSVFLLGLAVGALIAGRLADRTARPWWLLARIQIALGVYVALSLPIFEFARRFYLQAFPNDLAPLSAALWKFAVVLVVLITPTLAIGAVFPIAVRLLTRGSADVGGSVSLVYGLDTMGAALGALLSGFVLVTGFGLSVSTWMLGGISVIFGLGVLIANYEGSAVGPERRGAGANAANAASPTSPKIANIKKDRVRQKKLQAEPEPAVVEPVPGPDAEPWPAWQLGLVLATFFLSGLAALVLETGWNRLFYLMNGTSVYSLSSVLTGFLTGIGLGSLAMRRRIDRIRDPLSAVAITYAVIALGGVLVLRSGSFFEWMYLAIFEATGSYFLFQISVSAVIAGIVFCATVAMGANFPLVTKICTRVAEKRGFAVGRVFFWNTLGAVLGAFLGEFWILPRFGFAGLGLVSLGIYALGALVFLALSKEQGRARAGIVCAVLLAIAVIFSPLVLHFELPVHAVYYHGLRDGSWENFKAELAKMKVIDERQGFYGQVAVLEYGADLLLKHNGKTDASTNVKDNRTQILLGHLPLFFHPNPKQVLAIGLGGGATLRALTHNPDLDSITMVEIDPLVTAAARRFFGTFNDHALEDPRVTIVTNDGRNYVDSSRRTYDIISSEPPNIWVAGVSGLFTQEFYRSAKAHLNPGGVLCQWMPLYEMQKPDFQITLRTIRSVFPNLMFWAVGADIALVASDQPLVADETKARARLAYPGVLADLREIEMPPDELLTKLSHPDIPLDQLARFIGQAESENTDDLPVLEFNTARNLYTFAKEK
ncbi:MAG TPA: fused MFS/spermidine synthase [Thermoanaerobaculia bacterium]|jgi:spermidine synthase|nr:fused MFS/spermidine synthase [Thermoanaerobaculia bacterium]